jgi:hypothetical protein
VAIERVKGHQDDSVPYEDLPLEAQLNVDCDRGAAPHMATTTARTQKPLSTLETTWSQQISTNKSNFLPRHPRCLSTLQTSSVGQTHRFPQLIGKVLAGQRIDLTVSDQFARVNGYLSD